MATKFTCFVKFPQELKDRVWELALPDPFFVKLMVQWDGFGGPAKFFTAGGRYENQITGIARASKDSRAVALRVFPAFLPSCSKSLEIRFHPTDTLLYTPNLFRINTRAAYISNIRHLAIPIDECRDIKFRDFPELERLVIMNESIYGGINYPYPLDEVRELFDELKEVYDEAMLTMPKTELWERDEEGDGSMKYKEDMTPH